MIETKLVGWEAIEFKRSHPDAELPKYLSTEGAVYGITLYEGERIAAENPRMVFVVVAMVDL